ncbi:histidine kinase group protein [Purpureocillium lavendulum]|uniref:Histidine kinase group protein n=1 Tax=Purpureocillium lavendulum TaxID=1247861 RepID=A0AB34FJC8_9HYPO|nr:histidine kinase group protein [Purpureocillium lavendulum]
MSSLRNPNDANALVPDQAGGVEKAWGGAAASVMDGLDGVLLVPPDRSQILGRASWKSRYVVVGKRNPNVRERQGSSTYVQGVTTGRIPTSMPKPLPKVPVTDEYQIFVFKSKDDFEPIQQWPTSCVTDCQIQLVTNRKQSPAQPTLVITISDKERRRRSSRAAGFIANNKDTGTMTLWFRTQSEDHRPSLQDWSRFIQAKKDASGSESPASPIFTSPFQTRSRDNSDHAFRPGSDNRGLAHKSSTATYSTGTRDGPPTFSSESPSLRSKRSDISSPSSNNYGPQKIPYAIPEQHYTTVLPTDIGPSTPLGDYRGELIEGWTSAQGRTSTMSSPTRTRDSMSSQVHHPSLCDASLPPAPGETILDRAFQLGHIPGAEAYIPGQEKLSSIARFDALMREAEQRRKQKETAAKAEQPAMRSTFEEDDSSDDAGPRESSDSDSEYEAPSQDLDQFHQAPLMSPGAQRALAYIAGRHDTARNSTSHRPSMSRAHVSFHADSVPPSVATPIPPSRPHTAHAKSRPNAGRTQSTPHLPPIATSARADIPQAASKGTPAAAPDPNQAPGGDSRLSSSSTKRLSFTEFTKRLSSTSSLLLVQTNASVGSSRGSSEIEAQPPSMGRTSLTIRGASGSKPPPRQDGQDKRCGWRSSVGVLAPEGGFL